MMKEFDWNKIESRFDRTDKLAKVFK